VHELDEVARSVRSGVSAGEATISSGSLDERMAELGVPAVSLAVLTGTGRVLSRAWGAPPQTLFQAASISKPVTAMAVMRLAGEGVVDLGREVNELLRSWRLPDGEGVTVRRILAHTAGLGVEGYPGYERGGDVPTAQQMLDGIPPSNTAAVRVVRTPGEAYQYSGGAFILLQVLLEDVSGEPFAKLMRTTVLNPLGMRTSTYESPLPLELRSSAAVGHDESGSPIPGGWFLYPQAGGGLWSTATELLLAVGEVVRPGLVLTTAQRDAMLTPQVVDHHGLGWALDGRWFQHGGSNWGYHCLAYGSVEHRRGAVVMTNGANGWPLCVDLLATVARVFDWPDRARLLA
jgi:CubicO group peptidase (beta-lactamase class C family)